LLFASLLGRSCSLLLLFGLVILVQVDGGEGAFDVTATGVMARLNMLPASVT
jgi:hypothetical protein